MSEPIRFPAVTPDDTLRLRDDRARAVHANPTWRPEFVGVARIAAANAYSLARERGEPRNAAHAAAGSAYSAAIEASLTPAQRARRAYHAAREQALSGGRNVSEMAQKIRTRQQRKLAPSRDPYAGHAAIERCRRKLAARREQREARRVAAQRGVVTRRYNRLAPAVQAACHEDISSECPRCEGHGLVWPSWNRRAEHEVRCPRCGGEGRIWRRAISPTAVQAAWEARQHGESEEEQAARARACCDERDEWDGTLTSTWERTGTIEPEEAERIRDAVARRHEDTDYDDLLSRGIDRETARAMIY